MQFDLLSPRQQLVRIMQRIYYGGLTTLSGGNLSIRDNDDTIWITPSGIDKGKLIDKDMVAVYPDGSYAGLHKPSSELPFHEAIYKARPDLRAIVHAHTPALVAFSIVRKVPDTRIIPQAHRICGQVGYAPYALPGSGILGENISNTFAQGFNAILLENHGVVTADATLLDAFQRLETLDFCARSQMYAQSFGEISNLTKDELDLFEHRDNHLPVFMPDQHSSYEREQREKVVDIVHRACERSLMISTEGVVSARINDQSFLITPTGVDRPSVDLESLVLVSEGKQEMGKLASRSVLLHQEIYKSNPDVNAIITAQSPYATAFTISERSFDTKTIPESYIMLLETPKLSFGVQYKQPAEVSKIIALGNPVVLLQNDCVLTTGTTLLNAFDRLEVAEFTARSLVESFSIGDLVPIGNEEIQALKDKFLT
ncbi:MAG: class II aldolase/adducin family protein [Anaerolineaceae bacterium]|nr:class II aldolase/adducin family protein [Anaerolineaceae bacterium]